MTEPSVSTWLKAPEASRLLGVSPAFLLREARAGRVQGFRIGRRNWRFRPADLEAYVLRGQEQGQRRAQGQGKAQGQGQAQGQCKAESKSYSTNTSANPNNKHQGQTQAQAQAQGA
jgi:excisionase family DNA binding protein